MRICFQIFNLSHPSQWENTGAFVSYFSLISLLSFVFRRNQFVCKRCQPRLDKKILQLLFQAICSTESISSSCFYACATIQRKWKCVRYTTIHSFCRTVCILSLTSISDGVAPCILSIYCFEFVWIPLSTLRSDELFLDPCNGMGSCKKDNSGKAAF